MVRRHINKVKRAYTRARGIFGTSSILQNSIMVGAITGAIKNVINGQPPINISSIQTRVTQPNMKNPLIYLLAGYFLKSKPLMTIGAFLIVDPPTVNRIDTMPGKEIEALPYEVKADKDEGKKKICIH